jgi:4'-phosphopantetheinyl transferase
VWHMDVRDWPSPDGEWLSILDAQEKERAYGFQFPEHRLRYLHSHVSLRKILARYLEVAPAAVRFRRNEYGKAFVATLESSIEFSSSGSGWCIVHAVTAGCQIGADVEQMRNNMDAVGVSSYFSQVERRGLDSLPLHKRHAAFLKLWACKEAYLKGIGTGLSKRLDSFEVQVSDHAYPTLVSDAEDPNASSVWQLVTFCPEPGYVGAVATAGEVEGLELRPYHPSNERD